MESFEDTRTYGDYRGDNVNRSELTAEDHGEKGISLLVEDGDNGGRGAERTWASHIIDRERAFEFHGWLTETLYGERF